MFIGQLPIVLLPAALLLETKLTESCCPTYKELWNDEVFTALETRARTKAGEFTVTDVHVASVVLTTDAVTVECAG